MSNKIMNRVWESDAPKVSRDRLVLLALADMANDIGICWPGQEYLMNKCRLSLPTLTKAMGNLERQGQVEVYPRPGKNHYYLVRVGQDDDEAELAKKWLEKDMGREVREPSESSTPKHGFTPVPLNTGLPLPLNTGLDDPLSDPLSDPSINNVQKSELKSEAEAMISMYNELFGDRGDKSSVLGKSEITQRNMTIRKHLGRRLSEDSDLRENWREDMRLAHENLYFRQRKSHFNLPWFYGKGKNGNLPGYMRCRINEWAWAHEQAVKEMEGEKTAVAQKAWEKVVMPYIGGKLGIDGLQRHTRTLQAMNKMGGTSLFKTAQNGQLSQLRTRFLEEFSNGAN